jgi:hypothetical protein
MISKRQSGWFGRLTIRDDRSPAGRPKGHPQPQLTEGEGTAFAAAIFPGPDPDKNGVSAWTRPDLCRWLCAHFGKAYHPPTAAFSFPDPSRKSS